MNLPLVSPPRGRLKINIDGGFQSDSQRGGVGVLARDESGNFKAAWSKFLLHVNSALPM